MALGLEDKKQIVSEVNETASDALSLVIDDERGVNVTDMTEIRSKDREQNVSWRVVSNTWAKRAGEGSESEGCTDVRSGTSW
ncbi:50S ribosomal protein L10, partial [bacterium]|nr:50S ribosomal protein L10 [bacterium]